MSMLLAPEGCFREETSRVRYHSPCMLRTLSLAMECSWSRVNTPSARPTPHMMLLCRHCCSRSGKEIDGFKVTLSPFRFTCQLTARHDFALASNRQAQYQALSGSSDTMTALLIMQTAGTSGTGRFSTAAKGHDYQETSSGYWGPTRRKTETVL